MRRIVRRQAARQRAGISRTTEFRLRQSDPTWPRVVELTAQLTGYFEDELDAWLEARPRRAVPLPDAENPLVMARLAKLELTPSKKPDRRRSRSPP
jgi:predicted DNA-binding transcriptional regulator AlpA